MKERRKKEYHKLEEEKRIKERIEKM